MSLRIKNVITYNIPKFQSY